jgi:hypothetical protein
VRAATDPPRWARPFAYAFLALFLTCAVPGWEVWPLSGWKLFSYARTSTTVGWEVVTVDGAGAEQRVPWASLPRSYSGWAHALPSLVRGSAGDRAAACHAWADAVRAEGRTDISAVRAYRTRGSVPTGDGPAGPRQRRLVFTCLSP